ncbi:hypothetical protein Sm713_37550 [Streptomyces sp. TS71-3]|nr:hypothetical protein Sm713_37550 [Streptomyces sp. TS71-3]
MDAPAVHFEQLSDRQRAGRSCCWCSGTPDHCFPVQILRTVGVHLYACVLCAGMYGVPEAAQ